MEKAYFGLRLRGIPFSASSMDILYFFSGYKLVDGSVKIGMNPAGKKTGEAVILFQNPEEAKRAFREKQGHNMGHRWIELFLLTYEEYERFETLYIHKLYIYIYKYIYIYIYSGGITNVPTVATTGNMEKQTRITLDSCITADNRGRSVRLQGLPFSITEEDLMTFFLPNFYIV